MQKAIGNRTVLESPLLTFGAYSRKFLQLLEADWGIPPERVLEGTGLDAEQLKAPECMVPFADVVRLFNNGYRLCGSTDLGLRYAARLRPSSHGLLGAAMLTSRDLKSTISLFYDYLSLVAPFLLMHLEERRNSRLLVMECIGGIRGVDPVLIHDIVLLSAYNVGRLILGERSRELVFHFSHPAPAHAEAYQRYFDCHVQFNASCYGVSIPNELLDCSVPTADEDTHQLLVGQIADRMDQSQARSSFVDAVRQHLKGTTGPLPRMSDVAAVFKLSDRTFRNRLRRYNTSYQELIDEERRERALHLLRNTASPIREIAGQLGFQESSNFSRVFKKWIGVSPLDYRRRSH